MPHIEPSGRRFGNSSRGRVMPSGNPIEELRDLDLDRVAGGKPTNLPINQIAIVINSPGVTVCETGGSEVVVWTNGVLRVEHTMKG